MAPLNSRLRVYLTFMAETVLTDMLAQGPDAAEQLVATFTNDHLLVATDGEVYR